ncbi:FAD-binding and (Fe-S)-binding domain-containing protein [Shewanella sp. NIFS-20-20]|uniref:D-2-hydroxyglutarate dehydrogenase YdiJ n=1 Tax=Shewanella sp. NIFS-20-20 TaxID=2853806 RepID=UPI001C48D279|nr:FAD-binding and (Fe-S)-binding domain-containing protein [Shewanella sp. NIFS-20-20]MBV7314568.1 FAD-binding oxidoreductase [Shewanella sp. NIFS-20-20]
MTQQLPRIAHEHTQEAVFSAYLHALTPLFVGDIDHSYAARLAQATDNSVYQFIPQAVLYPRDRQDIETAMTLANRPEFSEVYFSARGGGTGTNGQSLTHGIVLDLSRYLNQVLEVNVVEGWARVEAGVVKDQLNDVLRPHGFFFSPDLSTSNRATIGGMINTDASGAGSLVYGKTSDHILGLTSVLSDGSTLVTSPIDGDELARYIEQLESPLAQALVGTVAHECQSNRALILQQFPELNRFLTGYDLKHVWNDELNRFDLSRMIAGSEGTLAVVTEAKLNITPLPNTRVLVNIKYDSFESALRHASTLVDARATVVETIDSKVLNLARQDIIWHSVSPLITDVVGHEIMGLNMVEFAGDSDDVNARLAGLDKLLQHNNQGIVGWQICDDLTSINLIYGMRKKAVGLLGATKGRRKPIAFAEDTAVPPESLADFILEFRALLDSKSLEYGMFGHVDAGVLHVRPALDMCDPNDEALLRTLSDEVAALTHKYGGLMWGEHGKGVRGEYAPTIFGDRLYHLLRVIKGKFDPGNRLNPGKLVSPIDAGPLKYNIDSIKRGTYDRQIPISVQQVYPDVMNCNGNGLCFNYSTLSPMCPSFKVTGDRIHSPKGRAGLMREWLRLLENNGVDINALATAKAAPIWTRIRNTLNQDKTYDYSHEVMASMQGCLACKACSSQCPVKVDVPKFRAEFFNIYYQRYQRPAKDYLVAGLEDGIATLAKTPALVNAISNNRLSRWVIKHALGYIDTPDLSTPSLTDLLKGHACLGYDLDDLQAIPVAERLRYVLIVQDPFNSFYDAKLIYHFVLLVEKLGFKPVLLPFKPNGKPAHIKGFLAKFAKIAQTSADFFNQLSALGMPLVGVDPALVLCYRDEYRQILAEKRGEFKVLLSNEWLSMTLASLPRSRAQEGRTPPKFVWFSHCTESTAKPETGNQWQQIFAHFGAELTVKNLGCCGMAGTYGHELANLSRSKTLFSLSWQPSLAELPQQQVLVSGYSCRSQVKRFAHFRPRHPLEALLDLC